MRLDDVLENFKFLEDKYTEKQLINCALRNFSNKYGTDGTKAEDKWEALTAKEQTWIKFKQH